jgi:glycosyltransferase involved in cell wall biosynthesis
LAEDVTQFPAQVLALIVLYKMRLQESAAFKSLQSAICGLPGGRSGIRVLLYDNTPGGCDLGLLPEGVMYEAAGKNAGLAAAYNRALAIAQNQNHTWLLILDQDTALPSDYFSRVSDIALRVEPDNAIAAIVPRMLDTGRAVSPVFIRFWGVDYVPSGFAGISTREIHATNSATLFRVSALKRIGGFNPYFWLDYADGYVFHQFHLHGMRVYVAKEIQVEHELSLLHGGTLKADRFRNILQAESAYWDLYGGHIQGLALTGRLLCRIWRQRRRGHDASIRRLTWNEAKRRMLQSKKRRIDDWKREMEQLILSSGGAANGRELSEERPSVSVCMAAFNGERYITAQIKSILDQLADHDELIVVDDASADNTCKMIERFHDARIRLERHKSNQGVLRSFEDAICRANGDILFLADQDDLWAANKVQTVLRAFQLDPKADVVVSDAALIDREGASAGPSYYAQRGRFRPGVLANILRCKYLGCAMAFRSRIRPSILPFPTGTNVLHDVWIGASNSLAGGKTLYVNHPLVLYRRHDDNATGNKRLSIERQIRIRWDLCRSLATFWLDSHYVRGK